MKLFSLFSSILYSFLLMWIDLELDPPGPLIFTFQIATVDSFQNCISISTKGVIISVQHMQVFDSPHVQILVGKRTRKRLNASSVVQLVRSFDAPAGMLCFLYLSLYINVQTLFYTSFFGLWVSTKYLYRFILMLEMNHCTIRSDCLFYHFVKLLVIILKLLTSWLFYFLSI